MEISEYMAIISTVISVVSLTVVFIELHGNRKQNETSAIIQIYDINRQLVSLGFSHPELFEVTRGQHPQSTETQRRYIQLWLNQMELCYQMNKRGLFQSSQWESMKLDIEDFMGIDRVQAHWKSFGQFYPEPFRHFIDELIPEKLLDTKKAGASEDDPPVEATV